MRKFLRGLIAITIVNIMKKFFLTNICCMNCLYYYVNDIIDDTSYCSIDKELIHPDISYIVKCKAFECWFGSM